MEPTDRESVEGMAAGDPTAAREVQAKYGDALFRFALSRLGSRDDALDVVQETLIAAWQSAGSYRGASSVSTWLFGICRNKLGERLRRREIAAEPLALAETLGAESREAVEFWECFRDLDGEQQELLMLVCYHGFSQAEVAETLGIPVGTVKSRLFYARRRLQELLEASDE